VPMSEAREIEAAPTTGGDRIALAIRQCRP
jgi:hypothetical protein